MDSNLTTVEPLNQLCIVWCPISRNVIIWRFVGGFGFFASFLTSSSFFLSPDNIWPKYLTSGFHNCSLFLLTLWPWAERNLNNARVSVLQSSIVFEQIKYHIHTTKFGYHMVNWARLKYIWPLAALTLILSADCLWSIRGTVLFITDLHAPESHNISTFQQFFFIGQKYFYITQFLALLSSCHVQFQFRFVPVLQRLGIALNCVWVQKWS